MNCGSQSPRYEARCSRASPLPGGLPRLAGGRAGIGAWSDSRMPGAVTGAAGSPCRRRPTFFSPAPRSCSAFLRICSTVARRRSNPSPAGGSLIGPSECPNSAAGSAKKGVGASSWGMPVWDDSPRPGGSQRFTTGRPFPLPRRIRCEVALAGSRCAASTPATPRREHFVLDQVV